MFRILASDMGQRKYDPLYQFRLLRNLRTLRLITARTSLYLRS